MAKPKTIRTLNDLRTLPADRNHNKGTERGSGFLETSLRTNKAARSIVTDAAGNVLAGNHVVEAFAAIADPEQIIVVPTNGTKLVVHQRVDVQPGSAEAKSIELADNRSSEINFAPDHAMIQNDAEQYGLDLSSIGYHPDELQRLVDEQLAGMTGEDSQTGGAGGAKTITCPHCGCEFEKTKRSKGKR